MHNKCCCKLLASNTCYRSVYCSSLQLNILNGRISILNPVDFVCIYLHWLIAHIKNGGSALDDAIFTSFWWYIGLAQFVYITVLMWFSISYETACILYDFYDHVGLNTVVHWVESITELHFYNVANYNIHHILWGFCEEYINLLSLISRCII